jgi:nitrate reductase NapE component
MSLADTGARDAAARPYRRTIAGLLDPCFGFFVWAAHLVAIYVATAVSCQLAGGTGTIAPPSSLRPLLAVATVGAAALVAWHARKRHREQRAVPDLQFRLTITLGIDAISVVAVAWQLFAVALVPLCA